MLINLNKGSVMFTIFLFISVSFIPAIQTQPVKVIQKHSYVEIKTEVCRGSNSSSTTLKLTKQQYNLLRHYISDFQNRFNMTTTQEEAISIYETLVVKLAELNLLPEGMTVQNAQNLMLHYLTDYQTIHTSLPVFDNWSDAGYNVGCLVSGEVHQVVSYLAPVFLPMAAVYFFLFLLILIRLSIFEFVNFHIIPDWYWEWHGRRPEPFLIQLFYPIMEKLDDNIREYLYRSSNNPFSLCTRIHFVEDLGTGRIRTLGILGEKQWDGDLRGIIPPFNDAVIGFSGFKFANVGEDSFFFIGSALAVGVGYRDR